MVKCSEGGGESGGSEMKMYDDDGRMNKIIKIKKNLQNSCQVSFFFIIE